MNMRKNRWFGSLAAGLLLGSMAVWAQDGADGADGGAPSVKSLPSEILPRTPKSLLLDIVNTGARLIAVGDRGAVIVSNDGQDWVQVQTPTRSALTAVDFPDPDHGWAVGHDAVILHTADGGRTWALQHFAPELEKPLLDVLFLDASRGFAVGAYGLMYQTDDGGQTWNEVDSPIRAGELHFNAITRLNDGTLFIAGEQGTLAMSADEGRTWTMVKSPYESSLFGAAPRGEKGVVIFGLRGNVFVADDARNPVWREVNTGSVASMFGATQTDDGRLVMVGLNGNIMVSANGMDHVELLKSKAGTPLSAAIGFGGGILAVGESGVQPIALR
ncbi:YCF48-related protein [Fontimonas sp. SYSU GA230001]|uniref:WD40/YVTN/BNR-like repeat-containing protein n=1 Tax=Fontimonas sp. SYSU GA230001 TaxID=3142450 RepID=UPI0032B33632